MLDFAIVLVWCCPVALIPATNQAEGVARVGCLIGAGRLVLPLSGQPWRFEQLKSFPSAWVTLKSCRIF